MLRIVSPLILFVVSNTLLLGQPIPCEVPPMMTSFCAEACIICDIDGFTGRHESTIVGESPPGFAGECTFFAHNMQWIAFIAGSVNLSVEMAVTNCQLGNGLEFGLYKGNNCENFERISNCFGGAAGIIGPGQAGTITNTEPLVIGQYYFIVMDGGLGDNCDWTFTVIEGSTAVSPLEESGNIIGDGSVCPDLEYGYMVNAPTGATFFEWQVNGVLQDSQSDTLDYTFTADGTYNLCVTAKNACDEAPPSCFQVEVESVPVTQINDILCDGETYEIAGTTLSSGGFYQFDLLNFEGCDSIVTLNLTELTTPMLDLDINICEGDTLYVGDTPYTQTGLFQEVLTSTFECDSIVNLDLFTIVCNISSSDIAIPVICNGEASGAIEFSVLNGTPPFIYLWEELNGNYSGNGSTVGLNETIIISDIPAGTYLITINDAFGNSDIIISEVTEPPVLELDFNASDYNGFNVTCFDGMNGSLTAQPLGGVPDYQYLWQSGETTETIDQLNAGSYSVTVTDLAGCTLESTFELASPSPITLTADFQNPDCEGPMTGSITVLQVQGGVGDYSYRLNNEPFTINDIFSGLGEGEYLLEVMDANGCLVNTPGVLNAPQIPQIELEDAIEISLGEIADIIPFVNLAELSNITWTPEALFECSDCLEQSVLILDNATLSLSVTSLDNCTDVDSVSIIVNKSREVFFPNVFSPNGDGINDNFTFYGGPEVDKILEFQIFNRWGAVVFEGLDLEDGVESQGWDGKFKGEELDPGVFAWIAKIAFIDGVVIDYSGDVTLLK